MGDFLSRICIPRNITINEEKLELMPEKIKSLQICG